MENIDKTVSEIHNALAIQVKYVAVYLKIAFTRLVWQLVWLKDIFLFEI